VLADLEKATHERADRDGTKVTVTRESYSAEVAFDVALRDNLGTLLREQGLGGVPVLATGAGHDAGVLASSLPTAMLFVRNPTGVSHAPGEFAEMADCLVGAEALAKVLKELAA
ncbi:MAG TPA: M20/M25/M40 family metallo-hydrolase, partial [Phytomonospora sp.]